MLRLVLATAIIGFGPAALAQDEDEHRPIRPKGRYFTQGQLQHALQGDKSAPGSSTEHPKQPLSENPRSLVDFAKQHPELMKSLMDMARELVRDNPDLLSGGSNEAAKKLAEKMAQQPNLGDLLKSFDKNLDRKPPPSNAKRKGSDKSDTPGRQEEEPKERDDSNREPDDRRTNRKPPTQFEKGPEEGRRNENRSPLADLSGMSPDFVKSLLGNADDKLKEGRRPTQQAAKDAIGKTVAEFEQDPAVAPLLNDPQTKEMIRSPKFREEVRRYMKDRAAAKGRAPNKQPSKPFTPRKETTPPDSEFVRPSNEARQPDSFPRQNRKAQEKSEAPPGNEFENRTPPPTNDPFERADDARKRVANENAEAATRRREAGREIAERNSESSEDAKSSPRLDQLTEWLQKNPGVVESLIKAAGGGEQSEAREAFKGMLDAFKGTSLEKDLREMARELNKDGAFNDLLQKSGGMQADAELAPRNPQRERSTIESPQQEAAKAFKALAGEEFNAGKLGDTMKSLGKAFEKQEGKEQPWGLSRSTQGGSKPSADGLGEGWLGTLGRGAAMIGEWSAKASQAVAENVAPGAGTRSIDPPSFGELRSISMPSAETGGKALLVVGIVVALVTAAMLLVRRQATVLADGTVVLRLPRLNLAGLPPREQAALLFERAALERLGEPARPKHHVALAETLCDGPTPDSERLADVYEAARYRPPNEPFEAENVAVVRDVLRRHGPPPKSVDGVK